MGLAPNGRVCVSKHFPIAVRCLSQSFSSREPGLFSVTNKNSDLSPVG